MRVLLISLLLLAAIEPELRRLAAGREAAAHELIAYWDAGPPSYRWNQLALAALVEDGAYAHVGARVLALLHVALHDATVASRDARDGAVHAATAGAASEVLASLFPARAALYRARAAEAARSRLLAGANDASHAAAGLALGREAARRVIERGRADGNAEAWRGRVPAEAGRWSGENPVLPQASRWRPWLLARPDELRPPPPPAPGSAQMAAEVEELLAVERTPRRIAAALFWEHAAGGARSYQFWNDQLSRALLEHRHNAPWSARAYALLNVALYDAAVACWDAKYAYWAMRPSQLDGRIRPLFTTPNHPSYPSGHSCFGSAAATVLAGLFPRDAGGFEALAAEASESRLWAGIHFRSDLDAGRALGRAIGWRTLERMGAGDGRR
jgi:hypothetical protein